MATWNFHSVSVKIIALCLAIALCLPETTTAVPSQELESMLAVARGRGYSLFANAIVTSDIHYEILSGTSFTFFAPTDASLFALDMTAVASDYITTLRYHVVPGRFSILDLRTLPSNNSSLPTLLPRHEIRVGWRRLPRSAELFTADGVAIVLPGLFYSRDIAVHGLSGILSYKSQIAQHQASPPTEANFSSNHSLPSPAVGSSQVPLPPANPPDHDRIEPPTNESVENGTIVPQMPEPENGSGFAAAPSTGGFQPGISPAFGVSPDISPCPTLSPNLRPPTPSIVKANNPAAPSLSSDALFPELSSQAGWFGSRVSEELSVLLPPEGNDVITETTATTPETWWPLELQAVDCPVKKDEIRLGHVSIQASDLYTPWGYTKSPETFPPA